jgi:prevent-host-death family protein
MAIIRPISDLRNKTRDLSRRCHASDEPVFITKNGVDDLVVMSMAAWERLQARIELYRALDEAEAGVRAGGRGASVAAVRRRLGR